MRPDKSQGQPRLRRRPDLSSVASYLAAAGENAGTGRASRLGAALARLARELTAARRENAALRRENARLRSRLDAGDAG